MLVEKNQKCISFLHVWYDLIFWFLQVKKRTLSDDYGYGSHVMQYGDLTLNKNALFSYLGTDPANENNTFVENNSLRRPATKVTNQRDADLVHFWEKVSFFFFYFEIDNILTLFGLLWKKDTLRIT